MEPVRALYRLGSTGLRSRGIVSSTIPTHEFDFRMRGHPGRRGLCFAVGKHVDDLVRLHVDEDSPERASTFERKIIDAKLDDLSDRCCRQGHDAPENGEPARLD